MEHAILSGLGLATPAGLNAYLPLLILALTDRLSDRVTLERPFDFLSSTWGIVILLLLLTVEIVVDKIPGVDHANDLIQSAIRPAAGGIAMMAVTNESSSLNPVVAMIVGLLLAGTVHGAKASTRPIITLSTGGLGNPLASMVEDAVAIAASLVAIFLPLFVLVFLVAFAAFLFWAYRRVRRLRAFPIRAPAPPNLRR